MPKTIRLENLDIRLGEPVEIAASIGHTWFPTIARFPEGELLVAYSQVSDSHENAFNLAGFHISTDNGRTWGRRFDWIAEHQPMIYLPGKDNSLTAIPAHLFPVDGENRTSFYSSLLRFENGGRRLVSEADAVRVVDWPWPIDIWPHKIPRGNWYVKAAFDGSAVRIDGRLLATGYARKSPENLQQNVVFASEDDGRTWRYWATIAEPGPVPLAQQEGTQYPDVMPKGYGGPSESAMIRLADGDLMAVYRVGGGKDWNLGRAYSSDAGRTWTKTDFIPAYSVEPSMVLLKNGTIALSTGRPGVHLWMSLDGRGRQWQTVDVLQHHNGVVSDPSRQMRDDQTTAYTELVEVSPNRMLLVYDRAPSGWKALPYDSEERNRIFVLPIEVVRR
jgi:hypothetical protein